MWLRITYILYLLMVVTVLYSQPTSRENFIEQRQLESRGKMEAFARKIAVDHVSTRQNIDVTYYNLNLNIDPNAFLLTGSVVMKGKSLVPGFQEVVLDLAGNMSVAGVSGDADTFSRQGDKLILMLKTPVATGESFQVQVDYNGNPQTGGFGGFVFDSQNGQPLIWTLSEPYYARGWWPCKDVPADKADSVDIVVTVPSTLLAASNGRLISEQDNNNGTKTFHWQERYPIPTYLVSLAITNYTKFSEWFKYSPNDSMEITNYVYPSSLASAKSGLAELPDMLDFFHKTFGPYPFLKEKYGVAQFGWSGGMEHQTLSSQGNFGQVLNVHELAHQWWGDMITNANWSEIWLNEGFASYSEALYFEEIVGEDYYHKYMSWMDWNYSGSIYRTDTTSVSSLFNGIVYDKGAWVLHMLRHVVGDSNFFDILQAYAADPRFKYGNATTAGFKDVCETVSGRALDWFFEPWILGNGRPLYLFAWQAQSVENGTRLDLSIEQTQVASDRLYPMPIDLQIEAANQDTTITIFNNAASQIFSFVLPFEPTNVTLDKENWILKQVDEVLYTSVESLEQVPAQFTLRQNYPNPFNAGTTIAFELERSSEVELKLFNLSGQLVRVLANGSYGAGHHRINWDGKGEHGRSLSSGIYIYQINSGNFKKSKKLILMK